MPTTSVIIPAYNAERTILETVESARQQTFLDFDIIVINDGSTDRTLELLNTVEDPRLKIFSYENGGVAVARNRGISHGTGGFSQQLQMAVRLYPKLLLNKKTQRLAMKLVLMQLLSRQVAKHLTQFISKIFVDHLTKFS